MKQLIKLNKVKPNPSNPRIIKDEKYKKLLNSINEFPEMLEKRPIVVDEDFVVLGGNMRLRACKEAGLKEVWIDVAVGWSQEKKDEFIIKDNVGFGEWEWDILANEWDSVQLADWGLDVWENLDDIEAEDGLIDDDEIPEVANYKVQRGDIWKLGEHRIMCGDSTNLDDVQMLVENQEVDILITDPPYNVDYTGKTKDALKIQNDKMSDEGFRQFLTDTFMNADAVLKQGGVFYIWHADSEGYNFRGACHDVNWKVRQCLIWNKNSMVMGRQDYHWKHEPCLYGWKDGAGHYWGSDRKQVTVMDFQRPNRNNLHPTTKPIELMEYQINNNTKPQEKVLDLFAGSGSTLIAAEKLNRKCYGMELDEKYCDVIIERWEQFTGKKAEKIN